MTGWVAVWLIISSTDSLLIGFLPAAGDRSSKLCSLSLLRNLTYSYCFQGIDFSCFFCCHPWSQNCTLYIWNVFFHISFSFPFLFTRVNVSSLPSLPLLSFPRPILPPIPLWKPFLNRVMIWMVVVWSSLSFSPSLPCHSVSIHSVRRTTPLAVVPSPRLRLRGLWHLMIGHLYFITITSGEAIIHHVGDGLVKDH